MRVPAAGEADDRDSPAVPHAWVDLDSRVEHRHLLDGAPDGDAALVEPALVVLVRLAPRRRAGRAHAGEAVGRPDELVAQRGAAPDAGVAVVEIADRDRRARADIVEGLLLEQAVRARVGVPLQVAAHPVVAVARAVREQPRPGVQEEPGGLDGPPEMTTRSAVWYCARSLPSKYLTPRARPRSSTTTSLAIELVRSSQLPVASALGMTVFCVPFFALLGQAKPQQ